MVSSLGSGKFCKLFCRSELSGVFGLEYGAVRVR